MKTTSFQQRNLKEPVADVVRDMIYSGALKPGSRIHQTELAETLAISKIPVREALILLEGEGLVENIPRRGSFVASLTRDDVMDHFLAHGALSAIATARAAVLISDERLSDLEKLLRRMESLTSIENEAGELEDLNIEFHRIIVDTGASRHLKALLAHLAKTMPGRNFAFTSGRPSVAHAQHQDIFDAIRNHDVSAAVSAMEQHLRSSGEHAVNVLDSRKFWVEEDGDSQHGT